PDAPTVVTGFCGGAIASGWAAQLAPEYAPELNLVGAAFGGVPAARGFGGARFGGGGAGVGGVFPPAPGLGRPGGEGPT
ncbi:lipase family protein, partial [Nocardia abscessus]|uniref:lipase family protein n=1 Tax=Nocardia abscessus TaxID=120957 RepID=UPI002454050B